MGEPMIYALEDLFAKAKADKNNTRDTKAKRAGVRNDNGDISTAQNVVWRNRKEQMAGRGSKSFTDLEVDKMLSFGKQYTARKAE
ncbi:hypothetical protein FRX31_021173 [Thalictrum thalictroides]|uniref:Uncharacterized protein n=1 Tax=Thalictrum thalictroides TaxID=46969 RepID=A0A7J6VWM7_THATH|nr:hypothetical protein FRX31_021173 [Thalictrum thalictroides]